MPKRTALYQAHKRLGAKIVNFAGWEMPIEYSSILEEHRSVRDSAGLFDLSHMGEIEVSGAGAFSLVQRLITNDASYLRPGKILYTPMCNPQGGIVDDILVYMTGEREFMLVVNAANTGKDYSWVLEESSGKAKMQDISDETSLLAIQGPESEELLGSLTDMTLSRLGYYCFTRGKVKNANALISRTGYTGEDGFELYLDPTCAEEIWGSILEVGRLIGLRPVGLGARDTLRLEMGYCLYGNDITEDTSPLEAGLGWAVKFDKGDFVGREALSGQKHQGIERKLIGFEMIAKAIPRKGYPILKGQAVIGQVTSGSFSPTFRKGIGLGYLEVEYSQPGTEIQVKIRGKRCQAKVVPTPFYKPRVKR